MWGRGCGVLWGFWRIGVWSIGRRGRRGGAVGVCLGRMWVLFGFQLRLGSHPPTPPYATKRTRKSGWRVMRGSGKSLKMTGRPRALCSCHPLFAIGPKDYETWCFNWKIWGSCSAGKCNWCVPAVFLTLQMNAGSEVKLAQTPGQGLVSWPFLWEVIGVTYLPSGSPCKQLSRTVTVARNQLAIAKVRDNPQPERDVGYHLFEPLECRSRWGRQWLTKYPQRAKRQPLFRLL